MSSSRWRDSDAASFLSTNTDPLSSPTDGYFSNRSHPDDMYIDTDAANKGAKITVTSPKNAGAPSQETTPLLDSFVGQAPPPSYLEATTPNPWNGRHSGDEGARLLSFDGQASPGLPLPELYDGTHKEPYRRRSFREHCSRRRMIKWIVAILFLVIVAAIFAAATHTDKETHKPTVPAEPAESATPALPSQPGEEYPIRWPSRCGSDYNVKTQELDFGAPGGFYIVEGVHQLDGPYKRVLGWIHVVKAPEDQAAGTIQAKLSYAASSSVDIDSVKYTATDTGLTIGDPFTPDGFDGVQRGKACLGISVVVSVATGAELDNFEVASQHLGMQVHGGVDLTVTNRTSISLTTGTLDASSFNSRETRLETIAGSITGKYLLRDLLSVNTKSGSVNINVEPKEAAEDGPETATFAATSLSGSIRVDFERKHIPERDYQVTVDTTVGSVDGTFIHGSKTSIQSVAGFITADIMPFKAGEYASTLDTETHSGQTSLTLRAPYKQTGPSLTKLKSFHKSISGALNLTYPQEWEGHVEGSSLSGSLHLQGRDLQLIHEGEDIPGGSSVEAKKGKGSSDMTFSTVSGSCEVQVGKL